MQLQRIHVAVLAALSGVGATQATYAQEAAGGGLEEIVVTATRREQNLQEVPISIVAITGEGLEMRGLDTIEKLSTGVPNVVITGGGGGTGGTVFRMRGIPGVGAYVDGVWQVATAGALTQEFVDVDRVEVLRGPQGTMFGRDSMGGALRLWTKRPAEEFGGNVTITAGSLDRLDAKASIDLPFGDKVKSKWTAANLSRGGYIESTTTGLEGGNIDQQVYRGDITWDPTEKLSFRFNYQDDKSTFIEPRIQDLMARTCDDPNPNWSKSIICQPEVYTLVGTDFRGQPVEPFFNPINSVAGYPGGKVGKWQNRSNTTLPNEYDTQQALININWQLTDKMKLQFLTAGTRQNAGSVIDYDNSQTDLVTDQNLAKTDVFSEEIQLTGSRERFEWLAGAYYWDQTILTRNSRWQVNEFQQGLLNPNNIFADPICNIAPLQPIPQAPGQPPPNPNNRRFVPGSSGVVLNGLYAGQTVNVGGAPGTGAGAWSTCQQVYYGMVAGPGGAFDTNGRSGQDGWALFGEATIHLTKQLDLTLGMRHHDQSGYTISKTVTTPKPTNPGVTWPHGDPYAGTDLTATNTPFQFDKDTYRAVLQDRFTDHVNAYVSFSQGYNSGGVSVATINGVRVPFPYSPATLNNYEAGVRSDLANGKFRFNATVFSMDWVDLTAPGVVYDPVTHVQIPTLITTNVGDAKAKGVELEMTFLPIESVLISVGAGFLDAHYTQLNPGTTSGQIPLDGNTEFEDTPKNSYTIGIQHTAKLKGGASFISRLDYNYQGQFWRSTPFLRTSAYAAVPPGYDESGDWNLFNARFAYEPPSGKWTAAFFGTNLTNEYMINSGFFHGIWGYDFATVGRPRELGASLTYRF